MTHHSSDFSLALQFVLAMPFLVAMVLYGIAVAVSNRSYRQWPIYRSVCFYSGGLFAVISVIGPLAEKAHTHFTFHMIGHLFLGMLSPLLIAIASPITLLLRAIHVLTARKMTRFLRSWPIKIYSNPLIASLLNIGGLWILYTTKLYSFMHENLFLHALIHFHVFAAGYLFTVSMIYIDPVYHRHSFLYRAVIFVFALAAHQILSKYIYANPPIGIADREAELGGMIMYYGGDAVDIILIVILCWQWYKATSPKKGKSVRSADEISSNQR